MPEYLAPGLFIEEIDSGSKPIEGVGTNTGAFIGYAKSGDFNAPTFITNWTQFCQTFGEEENSLMVALAQELKTTIVAVRAAHKASRLGWNEFAGTSIQKAKQAGITDLTWPGFLKKYNVPQGGLPYIDGSYLAHAVRGFYDNGGGRCYIIRIARKADFDALSFQNDAAPPSKADDSKPAATPAQIAAGLLVIRAAKAGAAGNDIKVEIAPVGEGSDFSLKVTHGTASETFPDPKDKDFKDKGLNFDTIVAAVNGKSKLVEVEVGPRAQATATRPDAGLLTLVGGLDASNLPTKSAGASELASGPSPFTNGLASLRADDFTGDEAQRTGLAGLVPITGVNFIAIPDLMSGLFQRDEVPGLPDAIGPEMLVLDDARKQAILDAQCALVAHCERMADRMAILDPVPGLSPQEMNDTTMGTPYASEKGQGVIYYPWVKISDPTHKGQQMMCPPSGHIAGMWARVGTQRGVHKAPANEALMGAVGLEYTVTKGEQELLNPNGINCIRSFPGTGIRVWGARTLATVGNPSWKYVNIRRLFNYLESSMDRALQWVVFEPNDQDLWGRVRRTISAFLLTEWREGKLFGAVPEQAFYVKCDAETNPQEMIDLGRLYCEVGVNPVKPAEFVIIRMGQWNGGGSISEG